MSEVYILCTNTSGVTKPLSWTMVHGRKSLDEICHSVEVEIPLSERDKVHKHDTLQVRVKNKYLTDNGSSRPITTVKIDEVADSTDASKKTLTVLGRSPARDIIDSQWSDTISGSPDLLTVAKQIGQKFKIDVMHYPSTENGTTAVTQFSWENESPWSKLLNEADAQGYILCSNQIGNLYLWKPASGVRREGFYLEEGKNVKSVRNSENGAEQFHEYIVKACGKEGKAIDTTCPNNRILTINLSDFILDQEKLNRRAKTEMLRRRENRTTVTVSGWGLTNEQIKALGDTYQKEVFWECNFLIPVKLPSSAKKGNMLISAVDFKADKDSMTTDIELVNKDAYR